MHRHLLVCFPLLALVACSDDASSTDGAGASSSNSSGNPGAGGDAQGSGGASSGSGAGGDGGSGGDTPYEKLPCSLTIGGGSGSIDIDSSVGSDGDVICVAAGSYSGGSITNLSKRTIQNDGGVVTITGTVHIGGLSEVTLSGSGDEASPYGFLFTGEGAGMVIDDANQQLVIHDVEAIEAGILLDAGHTGTIWSGDPSGFVLYESKIDRIHLARSGQLFQGNYGAPGNLENMVAKVEMAHILVEDSRGTGQNVVAGGGMFDMNVHDWTITAKNDVVVGSDDDRDTGVFYMVGSGTFRRMHRDGGWGWLVRTFGAQIGPDPGEFHCEDNVDLNTEYYGTCEIRNTDGPTYLVDGVISTVDIWIERNVSAHKQDIKGGYTTAIGLVANLEEGTTATLKDNLGCDNAQDYGDMESLHFFVVDGTVIKENNQQLESCDGVVDPITMQPL